MSSCSSHDRCRIVWARADVELSKLGSMSSWVGPGRCQVKQTWIDVSRLNLGWSQVGLGQCRAEWSRLMSSRMGLNWCWVIWARFNVALFGPSLMSSHLSLDGCWVIQAWIDNKLSRPRPCRVVRAQVDVESSESGPMLNRLDLGRCRVELVLSRLSQFRPSLNQVSMCPYQNKFNIIDKINLI